MPTTTAGAGHGGTRNNGATVLKGGNIDDTLTVSNAPYEEITDGQDSGHGSVVFEVSTRTRRANASGTFAVMVAGLYVTRRIATSLAGVANTTLLTGASDFGRRSIHVNTTRRTYHITSWDYVTGAATFGGATNDDFNDDHAATPTRAVPGEYVFTDHAVAKSGPLATALQGDYERKTG